MEDMRSAQTLCRRKAAELPEIPCAFINPTQIRPNDYYWLRCASGLVGQLVNAGTSLRGLTARQFYEPLEIIQIALDGMEKMYKG
jgi:hypothetical protein